MSKDRTSLSLDPEVADYLRQDHVNASGLVNNLVKKHMAGGVSQDVIREFRIQQVESELDEIEGKRERKEAELRKLKEINEDKRDLKQSKLDEAREALKDTPKDPENPAVENWAEEVGVSPSQLVEELSEGDGE